MGRDIHVILSEEMKSLPRDVQEEYVTLYSLKGDNAKLFEHPVSAGGALHSTNMAVERSHEARRSGPLDDGNEGRRER